MLRPWSPTDVDGLAAIFDEPGVWHYPFGRGLSRAETEWFLVRQLEHRATHGFGSWAAELKTDGRLIGYIGLSIPSWLPQILPAVEVGWRLHHAPLTRCSYPSPPVQITPGGTTRPKRPNRA